MLGYISRLESLGAVDGPGVRTVVFFQGCPLRCAFCHNPETWQERTGEIKDSSEILKFVLKYKNYYGRNGGVTFSGGEPLLQPEFLKECAKQCKENGIHTVLDTAGSVMNEAIFEALRYIDLVLLDIKFTNENDYIKYTGGSLNKTLMFLDKLQKLKKNVWIRQVIIPTINDDLNSIKKLTSICKEYSCIKKTELLPFKKLCILKYKNLKIDFQFKDIPECSDERLLSLQKHLTAFH